MSALSLPPPVHALAERLGALGSDGRTVALTQNGRMRNDARAAWMNFTARQTISLTGCNFEWRAKTGPLRVISVLDRLTDGEGALEVKALGFVPIARVAGTPEVTRGQTMRYLAELPWAPAAIALNAHLRWRVIAADRLAVSAGEGAASAEVELTLDADGRIATVFAPDRPRAVKSGFVATPWRGMFSEYRQVEGVWIPLAGEVGWVDGSYEAVWQGRIASWQTR